MGQKHGKSLTSKATKQYVAATNFNEQEVHALAAHFETISSTNLEDSVIDRKWVSIALLPAYPNCFAGRILSNPVPHLPPLTSSLSYCPHFP